MILKPYIVAEIGANHLGSLEQAKHLISLAATSGADCAKFQKRTPHLCVPDYIKNQSHPNPDFAYGKTYLEHRIALELSIEQHAELKSYCDQWNIDYAASVWDEVSANEIISLKPKYIKIPSAMNTNFDLIDQILTRFDGDIHISFGMVAKDQFFSIWRWITDQGVHKRVIPYHTTSIYPCPEKYLYLQQISAMKKVRHPPFRIGFSSHTLNVNADVAALALGANYFEHHFAISRNIRHTDACVSLSPDELICLRKSLDAISEAIIERPNNISQKEEQEKSKLSYSKQKN